MRCNWLKPRLAELVNLPSRLKRWSYKNFCRSEDSPNFGPSEPTNFSFPRLSTQKRLRSRKVVKNVDLWYQHYPNRLTGLWEIAKNAFVKMAFFHQVLKDFFGNSYWKCLTKWNERSSPVRHRNYTKMRTKISLETKIWPITIKFGPSDSFLFQSLSR